MKSTSIQSLRAARGVVLVVALIMLAIISLLVATSVGNVASSEAVNANTRLVQLATQSAEIALRYCEDATVQVTSGTLPVTPVPTVQDYDVRPMWTRTPTTAIWDVTPTVAFVLPLDTVNAAGSSVTYARPPECIVERMLPPSSDRYTTSFVVTARGFGPDVAPANTNRSRPKGTEVFLQSTIELN